MIELKGITAKQKRWLYYFQQHGDALRAIVEAGYNPGSKPMMYKLAKDNLNNEKIKVYLRELEMQREFEEAAHKARVDAIKQEVMDKINDKVTGVLGIYEEILSSPDSPARLKFDIAKDLLDRAGFKAVEKRELTGKDGGPLQSEHNVISEVAERARKLTVVNGGAD